MLEESLPFDLLNRDTQRATRINRLIVNSGDEIDKCG